MIVEYRHKRVTDAIDLGFIPTGRIVDLGFFIRDCPEELSLTITGQHAHLVSGLIIHPPMIIEGMRQVTARIAMLIDPGTPLDLYVTVEGSDVRFAIRADITSPARIIVNPDLAEELELMIT